MLQRNLCLTLFTVAFSTASYSEEVTGFTEICNIYTEAKNSNMANNQLNDYIENNIEKRVRSVDALNTHDAVFQVKLNERYSIFKQSAEFSLKQPWSCEAMQHFMK